MFITRPVVSRLFQQTVRRYHDNHFKAPSMDELPVPRGSWQAHHDAKQRKYNAVLLLGIAFSAGTLVIAKASGLIYLNYSPPKSLD
ncbi:cytochrome c oxidase subunit 7B [Anticarsia gemmatalis]|uniref:cytochrome c oxidase subunit 7B n=1 Tax=Anticarsia gemmatalis TaxID=129554 RepID=UPI003F773077